jgi:hypothetical protein
MLAILERVVRKLRPRDSGNQKTFILDLDSLPQCHSKVVIASPKYNNSHFACEVTVDVQELIPWAERHAANVWCPDPEQQASRVALPVWLKNADLGCDEPSYLSAIMHEVVDDYVHDFTNTASAQVTCLECGSIVNDVQKKKYDEAYSYSRWMYMSEWLCEKGHQLYCQKNDTHVYRGPRK